jgi:hypothetical protein
MRAVLAQQPDLAFGVAEGDEILAEQAHAQRRAIGFDLARQERRQPEAAHQIAHRRAAAGVRQQLIFFARRHSCYLTGCGGSPGQSPSFARNSMQ